MTPDELQQFNYMKSKYQEMVKSFDNTIEEVKSLREFVAKSDLKTSENILNHAEKLSSLVSNVSELKRDRSILDAMAPKQDLQKLMEIQKEDVKKLTSALETQKIESVQCKTALQHMATQSQHESIKASLQETLKNIVDINLKIDNLSQQVAKAFSEASLAKSFAQNISEPLNTYSQKQYIFADMLSSLSTKLTSIENSLKLLTNDVSTKTESLNSKIENFPKPVIPNIAEVKNQIQNQIEPFLLDARNASLRSASNEHKVIVLEKKIEQLNLLLTRQSQG